MKQKPTSDIKHYGSLAAEVYDLTKSPNAEQFDFEYYKNALKKLRGPVLEAGCGNGRLLIPLLKAGIDVVGLDISPDMLSLCRKNLKAHKQNAKLIQADLVAFQSSQKFDAILIPVGTFMLFETVAVAKTVLKNMASLLSKKGKLLIDIGTPSLDLELEGKKLHRATVTKPDGSIILVENTLSYRILDQVEEILIKYEEYRASSLVRTEIQRLPLRWWGIYEFECLARECGLSIKRMCADHDPKHAVTDDATYICYELALL